ncbi:MAG: hypothetical protein MJY83_02645 [Bacteroidales bacterium]|nr:hypothetical protein [Bacteroidales bacterium]
MKKNFLIAILFLLPCICSFAQGAGDGRDGWWCWDANNDDFQCYVMLSGSDVRDYVVIPHKDGSCHVFLWVSKLVEEQWTSCADGKITRLRMPSNEIRIGGGDMVFSRMAEPFPFEYREQYFQKQKNGSEKYLLFVPAK